MKNVYVLPTNKSSRLSDCHDNKLHLDDVRYLLNYKNIYITSDEKLPYDSTVFHEGAFYHRDVVGEEYIINKDTFYPNPNFCKRIILTTDESLFKYGVQEIPDEFLEWFVENPSCEEVEIYQDKKDYGTFQWYSEYKIIIPKEDTETSKEEPINCPKCRTSNFKNCHSIHCPMRKKESKQTVQEYEQQGLEKYSHELESTQEALEEAARKWVFEINGNKWSNNDNTAGDNYGSFITGAKWQQKQDENLYSEEDLREAFRQGEQNISYSETYGLDSNLTEQKWFERFKKK